MITRASSWNCTIDSFIEKKEQVGIRTRVSLPYQLFVIFDEIFKKLSALFGRSEKIKTIEPQKVPVIAAKICYDDHLSSSVSDCVFLFSPPLAVSDTPQTASLILDLEKVIIKLGDRTWRLNKEKLQSYQSCLSVALEFNSNNPSIENTFKNTICLDPDIEYNLELDVDVEYNPDTLDQIFAFIETKKLKIKSISNLVELWCHSHKLSFLKLERLLQGKLLTIAMKDSSFLPILEESLYLPLNKLAYTIKEEVIQQRLSRLKNMYSAFTKDMFPIKAQTASLKELGGLYYLEKTAQINRYEEAIEALFENSNNLNPLAYPSLLKSLSEEPETLTKILESYFEHSRGEGIVLKEHFFSLKKAWKPFFGALKEKQGSLILKLPYSVNSHFLGLLAQFIHSAECKISILDFEGSYWENSLYSPLLEAIEANSSIEKIYLCYDLYHSSTKLILADLARKKENYFKVEMEKRGGKVDFFWGQQKTKAEC